MCQFGINNLRALDEKNGMNLGQFRNKKNSTFEAIRDLKVCYKVGQLDSI